MKVVKRDGRVEEFIYEKIVVSILKAGAPVEVARRVAKKVECVAMERENISTKEIAEMVLSELRKINEAWSRNWEEYDRVVKKRG